MGCIHRLNYGRIVGWFPSEETLDRISLLQFAQRNWLFYALDIIMGEIRHSVSSQNFIIKSVVVT